MDATVSKTPTGISDKDEILRIFNIATDAKNEYQSYATSKGFLPTDTENLYNLLKEEKEKILNTDFGETEDDKHFYELYGQLGTTIQSHYNTLQSPNAVIVKSSRTSHITIMHLNI